ncbi:MAG: hypothetical protein PHV82_13575 [Victivallaceae bacterium]|nr:hypothetical protein [Victivallaceae bacterium]
MNQFISIFYRPYNQELAAQKSSKIPSGVRVAVKWAGLKTGKNVCFSNFVQELLQEVSVFSGSCFYGFSRFSGF